MMIILPVMFNYLGVYIAKHFLDNLKQYIEDLIKEANQGNDANGVNFDINPLIFPLQMYIFTVFVV